MNNVNENVECNINSYASDIRKRADEDYITARICYCNKLTSNFLWNGQQCIEKYLKSMALYHDINVKNNGHNLKQLFQKINKKVEFKSIDIYFPKKIPEIFPKSEEFVEFLDRLTDLGMNRYCSKSWYTHGDELIKLDASVFIIRRYCQPFGAVIGKKGRPLKKEIKACIDEGRDYTVSGYLGDVLRKESPYKKWLLEENFYFPTKVDIEPKLLYRNIHNHILGRRYEEAMEGRKDQQLIFIEMAEYLIDHLYFENSVKQDIERSIRNMYKHIITDKT